MREKILEVVLQMIEEKEDVRQINLRQVAKRAGCAHTNIYNYFKTTEEMLWQAAIPAMQLIKTQTTDRLKMLPFGDDKTRLHAVFSVFIEFALMHPGIFRFIWLAKAPDTVTPPAELHILLEQCWMDFLKAVFTTESCLSSEEQNNIGQILFAYLQGEIIKLINKRYLTGSEAQIIEKTCDDGYLLYELLKNNIVEEIRKDEE
jgi:AcrR family transcriptional regulator